MAVIVICWPCRRVLSHETRVTTREQAEWIAADHEAEHEEVMEA